MHSIPSWNSLTSPTRRGLAYHGECYTRRHGHPVEKRNPHANMINSQHLINTEGEVEGIFTKCYRRIAHHRRVLQQHTDERGHLQVRDNERDTPNTVTLLLVTSTIHCAGRGFPFRERSVQNS